MSRVDSSIPGNREGVSRWAALAKTISKLGLEISQVPGATASVEIVSALLGVEDAQAELLSSIQADTHLLREGPFRAGRLLLSEARRVGPADPDYRFFLERCRERLYDAHGLAGTTHELAVVELNIATVAVALGRSADALHWLDRSRMSVRGAVDDLVLHPGLKLHRLVDLRLPRPASRTRIGALARRAARSDAARELIGGRGGPMGLAVAYSQKRMDRPRLNAMNSLLAFAHLVEGLAAEFHDEPAPLCLEVRLMKGAEGTAYYLRAIGFE